METAGASKEYKKFYDAKSIGCEAERGNQLARQNRPHESDGSTPETTPNILGYHQSLSRALFACRSLTKPASVGRSLRFFCVPPFARPFGSAPQPLPVLINEFNAGGF